MSQAWEKEQSMHGLVENLKKVNHLEDSVDGRVIKWILNYVG
jgi:hypothetical protein